MGVNGILGIKLGMTQVFAEDGTAVPCTVLQAGPCVVVQRRTKDKDGYDAVQLGLVEFIKPQRVTKALTGHFKKAGVAPVRYMREIRIGDSKDETKAGDRVLVDGFKIGEFVDVTGVSKGKGFQGGVKRWHYRGGDARLDVSSRAGRHWRKLVSVTRLARPAYAGTHGKRAQDIQEFARRENRYGRKSVARARRRAGSGRLLHFYSQGQGETIAARA
jgi:50S ribosomal protein uL3